MNDIENAKLRTKDSLPKLKRDINRLNECVAIFENFLSDVTVDNLNDYENKLDKIVDSMELLEL